LLQVNNLGFSYSSEGFSLDNISLTLNKGGFGAVLGANGSGKTTLMRLCLGLLKPETGSILIDSKDIKDYSYQSLARIISYIPQHVNPIFAFTCEEIIAMGREVYSGFWMDRSDDSLLAIEEAMRDLDLIHLKDRFWGELSGGEQERVLIASALAQRAGFLMLDEPTTGLDIHYKIDIFRLLRQHIKDKNLTVLIITHDFSLASIYCDTLFLIDKGKIVSTGTPEEVLTYPNLEPIFGKTFSIISHPQTNKPLIIPN
jgi:iron complex transport system ATP-binding protein